MFNINTLKLAVRDLAVASVLDELEDCDAHVSLPESHDDFRLFVDEVVMADDDTLLELVANVGEIIGAVSAIWQQDVWLVFYHMGSHGWQEGAVAVSQRDGPSKTCQPASAK